LSVVDSKTETPASLKNYPASPKGYAVASPASLKNYPASLRSYAEVNAVASGGGIGGNLKFKI